MRLRTFAAASCWITAAVAAQAAGTVEVSFVDARHFSDAGIARYDEEANLRTLTGHLQALGQRHLADGQTLKIEVLDVDLAGRTRWLSSRADQIRVLRGLADPPRITLRYALQADGRVIRSAEETVSDLAYLDGVGSRFLDEPLPYEKRMLDRWFSERFAPPGH
jgi:hypothetical protein